MTPAANPHLLFPALLWYYQSKLSIPNMSQVAENSLSSVESDVKTSHGSSHSEFSGFSFDKARGRAGFRGIFDNWLVLGVTCFATLGGFLCGYDQGVVSNVLTMESFGASFPKIYMDSSFRGWFVSALLISLCIYWFFTEWSHLRQDWTETCYHGKRGHIHDRYCPPNRSDSEEISIPLERPSNCWIFCRRADTCCPHVFG